MFRVATDDRGRIRVWYQRKSASLPNQAFLFGHSQADPPNLEDFIAQCERRLSWNELRGLRERGILLEYE